MHRETYISCIVYNDLESNKVWCQRNSQRVINLNWDKSKSLKVVK